MALGKQVKTWSEFDKRLKEVKARLPSSARISILPSGQSSISAKTVYHVQKQAKLPNGKPLTKEEARQLIKKLKKVRDPRTRENLLRQQGYNPSQRKRILYKKVSSSEIKKMAWQVVNTYKTEDKRKQELKKIGLNEKQIKEIMRASRQLVVSDDLRDKDKSALEEMGLGYDTKKKRLATILGGKIRKALSGSGLFGNSAKPSVGHQVGGSTLAGAKKGGLATIGQATGITGGFETSSGKDLGKENGPGNTFKGIRTTRPM